MSAEGLQARGIVKSFGGVVAVDHVDLGVPPGAVTALIGPNGAGKTTLFDCLTGHQTMDAGTVRLGGRDLTGLSATGRARAGLGRTFQRLEVFAGMSVFDNLRVAAETSGRGLWGDLLRPRRASSAAVARARAVLDRLGLAGWSDVPAGDLPTGTLRVVELGRALCTDPTVLLLDEPASGLDAGEVTALRAAVQAAAEAGVAVLMVEHDLPLVLELSQDVYVLDLGKAIAHGPPEAVRDDPEVRRVYLGAEATG